MNEPGVRVVATLAVRVPLGATGSLADGAVCVVERIEAVNAVSNPSVRQVSPGLNATTVELQASIALERDNVGADDALERNDAGADDALARRELEAGVGVEAVEDVETFEPDAATVAEIG
ncbi:hypothetical protein [Natrarchaeobius chitinivorans]|uniref:Uncharacterized protein n=1 Tax=Natrarchaeobius chitinivorans TaxID=1679083 RepID=A0A3N6M1W7_NATCH|nr:hypothetical protein [Natrarchaeobius chitinivorans]RQG97328.1 hypothetical protein EA473_03110 [Natrarchaeobius chitinivorans]